MVVNEVVTVLTCPAASWATTVATYGEAFLRGLPGTQAEPSSRIAPVTAAPLPSRSATDLTLPPSTLTPISMLTGTSFLPVAGVTVRAGPPAAVRVPLCWAAFDGPEAPGVAAVGLSLSPHAVRVSGASPANTRTATRRLLTIIDPRSHVPPAHPALRTQA